MTNDAIARGSSRYTPTLSTQPALTYISYFVCCQWNSSSWHRSKPSYSVCIHYLAFYCNLARILFHPSFDIENKGETLHTEIIYSLNRKWDRLSGTLGFRRFPICIEPDGYRQTFYGSTRMPVPIMFKWVRLNI